MILRTTYMLDVSWQRLFQEIVIWRRLSHPNALPVLGVSPKLFPLCVVTEWIVNGNIADFISEHPDVNRLRLVRDLCFFLHSQTLNYSRSSQKQPTVCSICIRWASFMVTSSPYA